jgi:hypothetical protein
MRNGRPVPSRGADQQEIDRMGDVGTAGGVIDQLDLDAGGPSLHRTRVAPHNTAAKAS